MSDIPVSYVWKESEVRLTGRIAKKKSTTKGGGRRREARTLIDTLYEIEPANDDDGSWKKWVRREELYEIIDEPESTNDREPTQKDILTREEGSNIDGEDSE